MGCQDEYVKFDEAVRRHSRTTREKCLCAESIVMRRTRRLYRYCHVPELGKFRLRLSVQVRRLRAAASILLKEQDDSGKRRE